MKGLAKLARGEGHMDIIDIPEPTPPAGWVKMEIKVAGICGSDLHIYHDDIDFIMKPPCVAGHEFSGVVAEVGEGVTNCKVGDHVVCEPSIEICGECLYCRTGNYNMCPERKSIGFYAHGTFTNYMIMPAYRVHHISETLPYEQAALIEPLACVCHGVLERVHIRPTDTVLVSGPGPIGLLTMQVAKSCGATVYVSGTGRDAERLALAKELGADEVFDVTACDIQKEIYARTHGLGVDVLLEASGFPGAINSALTLVRRQGQFLLIGLPSKPFEVDFSRLAYREINATGCLSSRWETWEMAIHLVESGKVNVEKLVSHRYSIADWKEAFERFDSKDCLKILLYPLPMED